MNWIGNHSPSWEAYREITIGIFIAIDNERGLGLRPIRIGDSLKRLISKCVFSVTQEEEKDICGTSQLFSEVDCGIEGAVHSARKLNDEMADSDREFGFLLIDAKNAFKELIRVTILWRVRHLWHRASRYMFNLYRHWNTLLLYSYNNSNRPESIIHSKEGVTQGGQMEMVAYGIGILPLIQTLSIRF